MITKIRSAVSKSTADMELRVGNRYRLGRKIGSGSFGDIYLGEWKLSPERTVQNTAALQKVKIRSPLQDFRVYVTFTVCYPVFGI